MLKYKELKKYILENVFGGEINIFKLPEDLFLYTYIRLRAGIDRFFKNINFENPDWETKRALAENLYLFSGAKTYKNVWDLQKLIVDNKGMKVGWQKFYENASRVFDTYNVAWLEAEFETAFTAAKMSREWLEIEKKARDLPLLKYQTAGDERVRPSHAELDGIVRPVNDPFWDTFYPPNGFRCRCTVIQLPKTEARITELPKQRIEELKKGVDKVFQMNNGKHGYIFSQKHKYFNANSLPPRLREHFKVQRSKQFGFDVPLFIKKDEI